MSLWEGCMTKLGKPLPLGKKKPSKMSAFIEEEMLVKKRQVELQKKLSIAKLIEEINVVHINWNVFEQMIEEAMHERIKVPEDLRRPQQICQDLAQSLQKKTKVLEYKGHKIVCLVSVIHKTEGHPGICYKMAMSVDTNSGGFIRSIFTTSLYYVVAIVVLSYSKPRKIVSCSEEEDD